MFPSEVSAAGHLESIQHLNARIGEAGGAKFWFHALRNCFLTVADPELMLPTSLTRRLVNHAPSQDITEGYAPDWTMEQLARPPSPSPTGSMNSLSAQFRRMRRLRRPRSGRLQAEQQHPLNEPASVTYEPSRVRDSSISCWKCVYYQVCILNNRPSLFSS